MPSAPKKPKGELNTGTGGKPKPAPGSGQAPTDPSSRVSAPQLTDPSARVSGR